MAIMKIRSGNKDLSYVIQKKPSSGLFVKSLKQGALFSYFPNYNGVQSTNEYIIYFKDASDKITYKIHPDEQFEYLNTSKYNDARFINDAIQEIMHAAREHKGDSGQYDVPSNHSIEVNLVNTQFKTIDIFRRYFPNIEMQATEVSKDNYNLKFTTEEKMTFQYFLQVINLFGIFAQLNSPVYSYLTEDLVKKYVRICNEIDAPYFIRYLIKIRMCRSTNTFESVKADLEKTARYKVEMQHGDTHENRITWIKNIVSLDNSIIDIGTGIDYRYLKAFAPKLQAKGLTYYAIEIDFDARERIKAGIRTRGLEDAVEVYESLDEFLKFHNEYLKKETFTVICTEVLEHNEFEVAKTIVGQVAKNVDFDKFIITVPNAEFNQFYGLDGFRHDDHKWEATRDDVYKLCNKVQLGYQKIISNVGDTVNGVPVTFGLQVKKVFAD